MKSRINNILWGLYILGIGIGLAGNSLGFWDFRLFFPGWWTFFIIIPCVISIIHNGFDDISTLGLITGVLLLLDAQPMIDYNVRRLVLPILFIYIGIRIIFNNPFKNNIQVKNDNNIEFSSLFNNNSYQIVNENFYGGNLTSIFGGLKLDLQKSIINEDIAINVTTTFAGIDILVPKGINVKVKNIPIFGGVSNKASKNSIPSAPTIYVNSTCMFGGITIK
ncbi:MAG TPA: cell wall-active antibiotics response protein [Clostridiales bacterium]|nr:cell wall-active antibiotics response protein [Clostridiales bacterium]